MSISISRYLIENQGPDAEVVRITFKEVIAVCQRDDINEIHLLVPVKRNFPDTVVGEFLGRKVSKDLCDGKLVKITDGIGMKLSSIKTFALYRSYGMVIGVHLSNRDQDVLDSVMSTQAILLLPDTEKEGKRWIATWHPTILGKSTWHVDRDQLNTNVENALDNLTKCINLSTGLSHPSDRRNAQETFSRLKKCEHNPDPEIIRRWALRHNWQPKDANDLKKLAERYFDKRE